MPARRRLRKSLLHIQITSPVPSIVDWIVLHRQGQRSYKTVTTTTSVTTINDPSSVATSTEGAPSVAELAAIRQTMQLVKANGNIAPKVFIK